MEHLKFTTPLLLLICLIVPQIQAHNFHYCENSDDYDVKVRAVDITPYPVTTGIPFNFSVYATTGKEITGGQMIVTVKPKAFTTPPHIRTHVLCSETSCPVSAGADFLISFIETLPEILPPSNNTLTVTLPGEGGRLKTCVWFDFQINSGSYVADS